VAKFNKNLLTVLKVLFSGILLYLLFSKVPFSDIWELWIDSNPLWLFGALVLFTASKWISLLRLHLLMNWLGLNWTFPQQARLYLLGMFYNLFLPGGIGGDGYKAFIYQKTSVLSLKKGLSALLLDRISGVWALAVWVVILAAFVVELPFYERPWMYVIAGILGSIGYGLLVYLLFKNTWGNFWKGSLLSLGVQGAQLLSALFLLWSLHAEQDILGYLVVFLISSVAAVLPLTIGGMGSREITFYYGSLWLGLDQTISLGISLLFFALTALVSFTGVYYHFRQPNWAITDPATPKPNSDGTTVDHESLDE
jgi:uncharacterized membrane protein YbhN (UPF0104 family)